MNKKEQEHHSKFMSFVLRHEPQAIGVELDAAGWVEIESFITQANAHQHAITTEQLLVVVSTSDKKRFELSADGTRIRAAQGHSIKTVDLQYTPAVPPATLLHGTAQRFWPWIAQQGLIAGERQHVHLTQDRAVALQVGQRYGQIKLLQINAGQMHAQGHVFYQASNGVWLTAHVPVAFIEVLE